MSVQNQNNVEMWTLLEKKIKVSIRSMNVNRIVFHRKSDVNTDKRLKNLKIFGKLQYTLTIFNVF